MELSSPVEFNSKIQPAKLPTDCGNDLDTEYAVVIGNGLTLDTRGFFRDWRLYEIDVEIVPQIDCEPMTLNAVPGTTICALASNRQFLRLGDSGGPLLRQKDGTFIGIVSAKSPYEGTTNRHFFTKIHYYFDWISEITGLELPTCR